MKILITSDIHRNHQQLFKIIKKHSKVDYHLDAGDSQFSLSFLNTNDIISVKGNTDFFIDLPYERVLTIDNKKILLIHGHHHRVKYGLDKLINYCKHLKVDICIYGHTHRQLLTEQGNLTLLNPGALINGFYALYEKGKIILKEW